jgi:RimJ/RimL family protein N-acetyltransferase
MTLTGENFYLSPIYENDIEKFIEWINMAPIVQKYNGVANTMNERRFLLNLSEEYNFSIRDFRENELVGKCGFIDIDNSNQIAEIKLFIENNKYWNKKSRLEISKIRLDYGFKELKLRNIMLRFSLITSFNVGAVYSYEHIGFKIIGKRREGIQIEKKTYDIIFMDILEEEFYK